MKEIIDESYKDMEEKRWNFRIVYELEKWDIIHINWIPCEFIWKDLIRTQTNVV